MRAAVNSDWKSGSYEESTVVISLAMTLHVEADVFR